MLVRGRSMTAHQRSRCPYSAVLQSGTTWTAARRRARRTSAGTSHQVNCAPCVGCDAVFSHAPSDAAEFLMVFSDEADFIRSRSRPGRAARFDRLWRWQVRLRRPGEPRHADAIARRQQPHSDRSEPVASDHANFPAQCALRSAHNRLKNGRARFFLNNNRVKTDENTSGRQFKFEAST
jgi:hypothetical protein